MQLKYKLLKGGCAPERKTAGAAAWDIEVMLEDDILISPYGHAIIPLGIAFEIPERHYLRLDPRSSTFAKSGLLSPSSIIDEDYRGEVHGLLFNVRDKSLILTGKTRLFQIILCEKVHCIINEVDKLSKTVRGTGGLGST